MLEELRQVDVSILDGLSDLKRERDTLQLRLSRLSEAGPSVQDVVLARVRTDYEGKLAAIQKKAGELKQKARESYSKLKPLREAAQKELEASRLDEEEIELRHKLGELDDDEHRRREEALAEERKGNEDRQAEIAELVARFVGAFDSPEDLDPPATAAAIAAVPAPSAPAASSAPQVPPAPEAPPPPKASAGAVAAPPADSTEDDHTWVTPPQPPPAPDPPPPPTVSAAQPAASMPETAESALLGAGDVAPPPASVPRPAAGARLHALDGDVEPTEIELEPLTFVGRTPENQVRIFKPAVSRRHAQIASTDGGWLLRDLSSENGTYVNGQRVTERLLTDGDRVQFGTSRFVFKSA